MKPKPSPLAKGFGQRSLTFLSHLSKSRSPVEVSKPTRNPISLSVFLDRKLGKTNVGGDGSIREKKCSFSCLGLGGRERVKASGRDVFLDSSVLRKLSSKDVKGSDLRLDCKKSDKEKEEEDLNFKVGDDSWKMRSPIFADSIVEQEKPSRSKRLLVLGDDPKPMQKRAKKNNINNREPKSVFNHYANGSGLWACDREGVDSEEVGCSEAWEGMGSTTLGGLEWH